jgi:transposase InsO family protein
MTFTKTNPTMIPIGERRRPEPYGKPGYLRVDPVHQGDREGEKGAYHVNLVDEVTQWEIVGCVPGISEAFLTPLLEELLQSLPFKVLGFHSDNGSEYINRVVAKLLNKRSIEQTKSRPRRSNDNALVEGKNGAIIRKHMGHIHIPRKHAERINAFYRSHFNPYLNFHRPCGYARTVMSVKGKEKKIYDRYETPYEYFRSLPHAETYLMEGVTFEMLDRMAHAQSDNAAAILMQEEKRRLFKTFRD